MVGDQGHQKGGFLQGIGHVIGQGEQPGDGLPARQAFGLVAGLHDQLVGAALPGFGAGGQLFSGLAQAVVAVAQGIAHALRQGVAVGGMFFEQVELGGAALHLARQQQAGFVGHQGGGLAMQQRLGGEAHHVEQEGLRRHVAQHVVEPVADAEGPHAGRLHGPEDQLLATGFEPGHVADFGQGGGCQHGHGTVLVDEVQQAFAGAVPVDQKDDAGAQFGQGLGQFGRVFTGEDRGPHRVGLALVEVAGHARLRHRPLCAELAEQALEEGKAAHMQVGVGQGDLQVLHLDDQHMGVVGADVVLQQQALTVTGGCRVQTRVVELEGRGAMQALHEGADQRAVAVQQMPDVGAVDDLAGHLGGQFVDLLVQVHDQQVQAVAIVSLTMGERMQLGLVELLSMQGVQPVLPLVHAPVGLVVGGTGQQHRSGHQGEVFVQGADESVQLGHQQDAIDPAGAGGQLVQPGGVAQPGGRQLVAEVQGLVLWVFGVGHRRLQHGEVELEPVIGAQRRLDPHRHQQTLLAQ